MNNERWVILAALFAARTAMAFQFQTIGSVGPILVEQLGIDYSRVGTLIGLYLLPGVIISLPGGLLGQRFGAKSVFALGLFLMAAGGLMTGATASFHVIAIGRFVSGAGAVLMNVMATKMVADWFIGRKLTIAMAILVASWPFGIGLGLVEQHIVAAETGWAAVMNLAAAMALSCLFLMLVVYRSPPKPRNDTTSIELNPTLTGHELRLVLIAGTIWAIYNVGYIVLISFSPEFFTVRGYSASQSSWIVSLLGWMLMPMIFIGGLVAEKTHRPTLVIAASLLVTAFAAMALPFVSAPAALFVLIAFASGLPAGPIMTLPAALLRSESRAVGMGAFFTCYYAGMAVVPVIAGEVRDVAGDPAAPILFAAAMILCSLFLLFTFRALERPRREVNSPRWERMPEEEPQHFPSGMAWAPVRIATGNSGIGWRRLTSFANAIVLSIGESISCFKLIIRLLCFAERISRRFDAPWPARRLHYWEGSVNRVLVFVSSEQRLFGLSDGTYLLDSPERRSAA